MSDLPRLNDRWATNPSEKQIFQKQVDGEKNNLQRLPPYLAWAVEKTRI